MMIRAWMIVLLLLTVSPVQAQVECTGTPPDLGFLSDWTIADGAFASEAAVSTITDTNAIDVSYTFAAPTMINSLTMIWGVTNNAYGVEVLFDGVLKFSEGVSSSATLEWDGAEAVEVLRIRTDMQTASKFLEGVTWCTGTASPNLTASAFFLSEILLEPVMVIGGVIVCFIAVSRLSGAMWTAFNK